MRKTLTLIAVVLILSLCGCSNAIQTSDISTEEPVRSESLQIKDSEESFKEPVAPQSSVNIDTCEEFGIASETPAPDVKETESAVQPKEEARDTGDSVTNSSFEPVKPSPTIPENKASETAPVEEKPKKTKPPAPPVEIEPEPEPELEPSFDINYWISYAQGVAVSKGLTLESSAVDFWNNPITANLDCICLERDINSRLNRYAGNEEITDV